MIVVIIVSLIALSGLVLDGGRLVAAYLEISDDAQNAGRIGTQQLVSIRAGDPIVDFAIGHREMSRYLQEHGHNATVYVDGAEVTVVITKRVNMTILSMFGVSSRTVRVQRTVQAVSQ
jgi:hypothetical protein